MTPLDLNRQQKIAAETLDGPLLISAGAGSGKTSVLTTRSANAVVPEAVAGWEPIPVDRLLAITFTDKAAGELAERVRGALRAAGRKEDARRIDSAWISTIHGMCSRMLRQSALEVGLDPAFSVIDAVRSGRLRAEAFESAAVQLIDDDAGVRDLLTAYPVEAVAEAVNQLADDARTRGVEPTEISFDRGTSASALLSHARDFFETTCTDLRECGVEADHVGDYLDACGDTAAIIRSLEGRELSDEEVIRGIWDALSEHRTIRKHAGVTEIRDRINETRQELACECTDSLTASMCGGLLRLTSAFLVEYQAGKRQGHYLDFDDLQIETRALLADPATASAWTGRFDLTMVDEFQDTDTLQLEIVERLAGERLCSVGDEQQSIYGFRGADVGVYREHRRRMEEANATAVTLRENYRSHAQILRFVNEFFGDAQMFDEGLVRLEAAVGDEGRVPDRDAPRVEVLVAERCGSAGQAPRQQLADEVAARVQLLVQSGPVQAGDVAVLLRSYTHAEDYASALRRRGIDTVVAGGNRFLGQPEVTALTCFVRVLANPEDEEALVLLAASPMWEISDDGLLALRFEVTNGRAARLWQGLSGAELSAPDRIKVDALQRVVESAQSRLARAGLRETILRAVEESGFDLRLLASDTAGGQAYANVLKFARLADGFEATGGSGAAALVTYLDDKVNFRAHEAPASLVTDGSNAVTIMSIHASKGLEFPVVIVGEIGEPGMSDKGIARWDLSGSGRIALQLPRSFGDDKYRRPAAFSAMDAELKQKGAEEVRRLLYVACTRARDVLILAGACNFKTRGGTTMLGDLLRVFDSPLKPGSLEVGMPEPLFRLTVLPGIREDGEAEEAHMAEGKDTSEEEWLKRALGETADTTRPTPPPARMSYSAIHAYESCAKRFVHEHASGKVRLSQGDAAALGSAVHAALELAGESGHLEPVRLESIATHYRLNAKAKRRLVAAIEAYARSSAADLVRAATGSVYREAQFALTVGRPDCEFLLEGTLDIYATSGPAAVIVDFKTGDAELDAAEMRTRYDLQARCYALAALKEGSERVEVVFVRLEQSQGSKPAEALYAFSASEVEALEGDLSETYRRVAGTEHPARVSRDVEVCHRCPVPVESCGYASLGRD